MGKSICEIYHEMEERENNIMLEGLKKLYFDNVINPYRNSDKIIDMHTHTDCSDGELSCEELIRLAIDKRIGTLAITDHDTISGVKSIDKNSDLILDSGIEIIDGIELSSKTDKGRMHILGYGIDLTNEALNNKMDELKDNSINSVLSIMEQIKRDYGIRFCYDDIRDLVNANHNLGRPDLANKNENDFNILKETLLKGYLKNDESKMIASPVDLDEKIEEFLKLYSKNMIKSSYFRDDSKHYQQLVEVRKIRNFIEKMAAWYEFRFPDEEVIRLFNHDNADDENYNNFSSNIYSFDYNKFFECLNFDEKSFLDDFKYPNLFYLDHDNCAHLHLNSDGIVENSEYVFTYTNFKVKDEELIGMHIKDVVELFKDRKVDSSCSCELNNLIDSIDKKTYFKNEILNCVMYRLIESGRVGARRAFLFAEDFERDIDIPMMYGIDISDKELKCFIDEYLKAGGSKDLICYANYLSIIFKKEIVMLTSIDDLIKNLKRYDPNYNPLENHEQKISDVKKLTLRNNRKK